MESYSADNSKVLNLNSKIITLMQNDPLQSHDEVRNLIFKAIELDNGNPVTLTNFGAYLCNTGNHLQALRHLNKAASVKDYHDYNLYFNIGVALMNISVETRKQAPEYFKKAKLYDRSQYTIEAYMDFMAY